MQEIVNAEAVSQVFAILAIACPLLGIVIGAIYGKRRGDVREHATTGLLIGLFGTLNWLLWTLYNRITAVNGLDTVRNLVINLVLFLVIGSLIGFLIGWRQIKSSRRADTQEIRSPSAQ